MSRGNGIKGRVERIASGVTERQAEAAVRQLQRAEREARDSVGTLKRFMQEHVELCTTVMSLPDKISHDIMVRCFSYLCAEQCES